MPTEIIDTSSKKTSPKKRTLLLCAAILMLVLLWVAHLPYRALLVTSLWQCCHAEKIVLAIDGKNPGLTFIMGEYYFNGGAYNLAKAEYYYTRTLILNPQYLEAYYQRGRIFFVQGKFTRAAVDMEKVLQLDPEFKRAYYMLGLIHGYSGELGLAAEDFKAFLAWKPESWAGHNDLVWVYFQQGDYQSALDTATDGLRFAPDNAWLLNSQGVALLNLGKKDEARVALTRALTLALQIQPGDWGEAYPGNNPAIYSQGLTAMQESIQKNLALLESEKK